MKILFSQPLLGFCLIFCVLFLTACGVKGPPLPPLHVTPQQTEPNEEVSPSPAPGAKS